MKVNSAGVTAFVKAKYLQNITSFDVYDAVDLNYWSNAESTVTIMAASIPILRVLVKDVGKTFFSRSPKYYYPSLGTLSNPRASRNKTQVTVQTSNRRPGSEGTDGSELDILPGKEISSKGGIVQTSKYTVEYEEREWKGGKGDHHV